jgi:hypothetical protein
MRDKKRPRRAITSRPNLRLGFKNYLLFGIALVAIGLGFFSLASGSITLAPILLVLGYCVLVPLAILLR